MAKPHLNDDALDGQVSCDRIINFLRRGGTEEEKAPGDCLELITFVVQS